MKVEKASNSQFLREIDFHMLRVWSYIHIRRNEVLSYLNTNIRWFILSHHCSGLNSRTSWSAIGTFFEIARNHLKSTFRDPEQAQNQSLLGIAAYYLVQNLELSSEIFLIWLTFAKFRLLNFDVRFWEFLFTFLSWVKRGFKASSGTQQLLTAMFQHD